MKELVLACIHSSPTSRPNFRTICDILDILFIQVHVINQDRLELYNKKKKEEHDSDCNHPLVLKDKYGLDEELMKSIVAGLDSLPEGKKNTKRLFTIK